MMKKLTMLLVLALAAGLGVFTTACAQEEPEVAETPQTPMAGEEMEDAMDEAEDTAELLADAQGVLQEMQAQADVQPLLQQAQGIFIVPSYGKAAVGIGVRGGEGVLMARGTSGWNGPAFYDIGSISIGAQVGAEGGDIVALLMSQEAMDQFRGDTEFSLNADAGLTIVDWSTKAEGQAGGADQDVILWTDVEGLFAGASLGVTGVSWDEEENMAYYGQAVRADGVLGGQVTPPTPSGLASALPS